MTALPEPPTLAYDTLSPKASIQANVDTEALEALETYKKKDTSKS